MKPTILIILAALAVSGCAKKQDEIVKDSHGKLYRLQWALGASYQLIEIDSVQLQQIRQLEQIDTIK